MPSKYKKPSLYSNTPIKNWYLGHWPGINVNPSLNDEPYIIPAKYNLRPDLAAYHFYGSTTYWYVFALRNKNVLKDPIFDFIAGREIIIPNKKSIEGL